MAISNSDIIYSSTIYTHTPCTIFLRNQNNRHNTRAKADTNIPSIQKCLYLLLNLFLLLGIGPVWCPVGKCSTRYKINLAQYHVMVAIPLVPSPETHHQI